MIVEFMEKVKKSDGVTNACVSDDGRALSVWFRLGTRQVGVIVGFDAATADRLLPEQLDEAVEVVLKVARWKRDEFLGGSP